MNKVVLVSSGQPCGNPRMVKEALVLKKAGFEVSVLYCPLSPWGDDFDKKLFQENTEIYWTQIGPHPLKRPWRYMFARLRMKFWEKVFKCLGNVFDAALKSSVLFSQDLVKAACARKANMYIGHNLGAINAVVRAAKKHGAKAYFDFEDFHRGEEVKDSLHWKRVEIIENNYIPELKGAWAASPLISDAYNLLFPNVNIETINNCFPFEYKSEKLQQIPSPELKMFWFSQTIGKNRGLEQIIQSIGKLRNKAVKLTLLGNCTKEVKAYFIFHAEANGMESTQITFLDPVSEIEIVRIASEHHIGIASEVPHVLNRELCLTNKIFLYLLAGNAILFSNTPAQEEFATENSNIGLIYPIGDIDNLASCIDLYIENRNVLNEHRLNSLELSKKLNWEIESQKLIRFLNLP